jgi:hypothetical protein
VTDEQRQQELAEQREAFWRNQEDRAEREFIADVENMSLEEYAAKRQSLGVRDEVSYE